MLGFRLSTRFSGFRLPFRPFGVAFGVVAGVAATTVVLFGMFFPVAAFGEPCVSQPQKPFDLGNARLGFAQMAAGEFEGGGIGGSVRASSAGLQVLANGEESQQNGADLRISVFGGAFDLHSRDDGEFGQAVFVGAEGIVAIHPTHGQLEALEVVPGVDLVVEATQRRVNLLFSGMVAAFEGFELELPNATSIRNDPASGDLEVVVPVAREGAGSRSERVRGFDLELMALDSDGDRLGAVFMPGEAGAVGIRLEASQPTSPVQVIVTALYASYSEPNDVATSETGGLVAIGGMRGIAGSPQRHGFVAEVNSEGRQVDTMTYLNLDSDLSLNGVAASPSGDILLAGSTEEAEGRQAFLGVLEAQGRGYRQVSGVGVPGAGASLGTAHDIEVAPDGTVWVVGERGAGFMAAGREAAPSFGATFSVALPSNESMPKPLFVAALAPGLDEWITLTPLLLSVSSHRLRAWVDCNGELAFGIPWRPKQQQVVTHTYRMPFSSSAMSECPHIDDGWGYGAMCWKWLKTAGDYSYHPENLDEESFPALVVQNPEPAGFEPDFLQLNRLEANELGNLFFHSPSGAWSDPSGSWGAKGNWAYSREEIALAAAIYQDRWKSPAFANFRFQDGSISAVMMRAETFSADSASDLPHNICNEDTDGDGHSDWSRDPYPTPPEHQVARACAEAHVASFELDSVEFDAWLNDAYSPNKSVSGSDASWFAWSSPYVGDPPEAGEEDQFTEEHLREISRRLQSSARNTVDLELTRVVAGVAQPPTVICAEVAAHDMVGGVQP